MCKHEAFIDHCTNAHFLDVFSASLSLILHSCTLGHKWLVCIILEGKYLKKLTLPSEQESTKQLEDEVLGMPVSFSPLYKSIKGLKKAATNIDNQKKVASIDKIKSLFFGNQFSELRMQVHGFC